MRKEYYNDHMSRRSNFEGICPAKAVRTTEEAHLKGPYSVNLKPKRVFESVSKIRLVSRPAIFLH